MVAEWQNIAIAELVVYIPSIFLALALIYKHRFSKGRPWIYLIFFCGFRIGSAILAILSFKVAGDAPWPAIIGAIALSPLLLVASGLLRRVNDFIRNDYTRNDFMLGSTWRTRVLETLHLPISLALVLCIVGGSRLASSNSSGMAFERTGGIILLVSYIAIVALAILTLTESRNLPRGEKRILYAVLVSLPLLAVRLIYSLLADFVGDATFDILYGNATVQLCMVIIEEFIITALFLIAGFVAPALDSLPNGVDAVPMNTFDGRKGVV